jgi:ribonuclease HII
MSKNPPKKIKVDGHLYVLASEVGQQARKDFGNLTKKLSEQKRKELYADLMQKKNLGIDLTEEEEAMLKRLKFKPTRFY